MKTIVYIFNIKCVSLNVWVCVGIHNGIYIKKNLTLAGCIVLPEEVDSFDQSDSRKYYLEHCASG